MTNIEKDISVLKRKLDEVSTELIISYKKLGKKLLLSDTGASSVSENFVSLYNKMLEERALLTGNILEIKSSHERLTELCKFKKQISRSLKETDNSISKLKAKFALSIYKSFKDWDYFSMLDDEIEKAEAEIEELSSSTEALSEEKKDAGFLSKFNINRKIAGNKFKASLLKRNIERRLCKHSNDIFEAEEISSLLNEKKMIDEQELLYKKILDEELSKKDLDNRISDIEEEENFLLDKMQVLCENIPHLKKLSGLNLQIKEIDENVDEILKNVAIEFASPFLDENSEKKETIDKYSDDIQEIKNLMSKITTINYNIEYCSMVSKKDAISNKITYMSKAVENCEKEIKNYEQKIEKLKEDIEINNNEKEEINEKLIQLETLITDGK